MAYGPAVVNIDVVVTLGADVSIGWSTLPVSVYSTEYVFVLPFVVAFPNNEPNIETANPAAAPRTINPISPKINGIMTMNQATPRSRFLHKKFNNKEVTINIIVVAIKPPTFTATSLLLPFSASSELTDAPVVVGKMDLENNNKIIVNTYGIALRTIYTKSGPHCVHL